MMWEQEEEDVAVAIVRGAWFSAAVHQGHRPWADESWRSPGGSCGALGDASFPS